MFEVIRPRFEVAIPLVISTRHGWHGAPDLASQDERILDLDPSGMSADEALSALVALQAHRARLDAVEVELLLRSAGAVRVVREVLVEQDDVGRQRRGGRVVHMVDEVVDEIACALHRSHGQLQLQVAVPSSSRRSTPACYGSWPTRTRIQRSGAWSPIRCLGRWSTEVPSGTPSVPPSPRGSPHAT
jgi:hypothetical protein